MPYRHLLLEERHFARLIGVLKNIRDGKIKPKDVQVSYVHIDKDQSKIDELEINDQGNFESNWRHGFFTERLDLL